MLIPQSWLTNLARTANPGWSVTPAELDAGFVRVGFETEGHAPLPETTGPLVIGRVTEIEELTGFKKPIRLCRVDVGEANGTGEPQTIICGARNFAVGSLVPVSLPGATLPGGFGISARRTYGHVSEGMICSAAELGFTAQQTAGIITLPEGAAEPGEDARPVLGMDEEIFDVNITPDRGYALSARGLLREICSAFDLEFRDPAAEPGEVPAPDRPGPEVRLDPATGARRFGLRRVTGLDPHAESPWWLQRILMLCGARPVNVPTDVTNYVMFLLGQPMHAFDATRLDGGLEVRPARPGETLETLDGAERTLDAEDVVIADDAGVRSLAGVMGGADTAIGPDTTEVLLEAACWDPIGIARTSRRHKLGSEASRRFERGVDPALVEPALDLACELLAGIAGGRVTAERTLVGEVASPEPIIMAASRPGRVAGVEYPAGTVVGRLREVGCEVRVDGGELHVTPPSWRPDLTMPAELVEEVLRLEGLEDIPAVLPAVRGGRGLGPAQRRRRVIGHALAHTGHVEILPSPFMSTDLPDTWELPAGDPRRRAVAVRNPLEADHAVLATTLLPALLEALGRNIARGIPDLALFGLQQVSFRRADRSPMPDVAGPPSQAELAELLASLPEQPLHVAVAGAGRLVPAGPWGGGRDFGHADAVEAARIVARACGVRLEPRQAEHAPWHPGRCAELVVGGDVVGHAGELHPKVLERMGLPPRVCAMEMDVTALPFTEERPAPVLSAFPALHQDLALVAGEDVPAAELERVLRENAGELLEDIRLYDVYRSEAIGPGRRSLTFSLSFRAPDRTLTDAEVNGAREAAAAAARELLGAEPRI